MKKNMGKGLLLFVTTVLMSICFIFGVGAVSGECGDNAVWSFDEETKILTISGTGAIDSAFAQDEENGDFLFFGDELITNIPWADVKNDIIAVVIEEGITSIGHGAFYRHYNLESVILPDTLEEIGYGAFCSCVKLEKLNIPDSVKVISSAALAETSIRSFTIADSVERMTIYNTDSDYYDFNMCCYLESITIPESLGANEFVITPMNTSLRSVYNRSMDAIVHFESDGFIFDGTETSKWFADEATAEFYGLSFAAALESFVYSDGDYTEEELNALQQEILLDMLVEKYGENYAENLPVPAYSAQCPSYMTVYCYEGSQQEGHCIENGINYVTIDPEHICTDSDASEKCDMCGADMCGKNLVWTVEDGTLTISGTGAMFDYGYNEEADQEIYPSYTNFIIGDDGSYINGSGIEKIVVEEGVTTIGNCAFAGLDKVTEVSLPSTVTSIGSSAFTVCKMKELVIPEGVIYIGDQAFNECTELEKINIPAGIKRIEPCTFLLCTSLKEITIPETVEYLGDMAFGLCSSLETFAVENKDCEFAQVVLLDADTETGEYKELKTVIIGHEGSTAEAYAKTWTEAGYPITFRPFHTHSYTAGATTATCTKNGEIVYSCNCGDTYSVADSAKGHSFTNYVSDNNATCTADGTKTAVCNNGCGAKDTVKGDIATGHTDADGNNECDSCGKEIKKLNFIQKLIKMIKEFFMKLFKLM